MSFVLYLLRNALISGSESFSQEIYFSAANYTVWWRQFVWIRIRIFWLGKIWTTGPKVPPNIDRSSFYRRFHVTSGQLDFWLPLTEISLSSFCFCRCGFIQGLLLTLWSTFFSSSFFFGLLCVDVISLCFRLMFHLQLDWVMFSLLHVSFHTARAGL